MECLVIISIVVGALYVGFSFVSQTMLYQLLPIYSTLSQKNIITIFTNPGNFQKAAQKAASSELRQIPSWPSGTGKTLFAAHFSQFSSRVVTRDVHDPGTVAANSQHEQRVQQPCPPHRILRVFAPCGV